MMQHQDDEHDDELLASADVSSRGQLRRSSRKRRRPAYLGADGHTEEEETDATMRTFRATRPEPTMPPLPSSNLHRPDAHAEEEEELHRLHDPGTTASLQMGDVDVDGVISSISESQPDGREPMQEEEKKDKDAGTKEKEEEEKRTCGICFEEVKEQGVLDSCRHDFCFDCIHRWSKVANTCPMCKAAFYTISRRHDNDDTNGRPSTTAAEDEDEEAYAGDRPGKRRRSGRRAAAATANKRSRTTMKKKKPDVVRVKPKKQQYRYSRREIEDIARAAEAAEINHNPQYQRVMHGYHDHASLVSRMLMPQQTNLFPPAMGLFFGLGLAADQSESEGERHRSDDEDHADENEDEDHLFGLEDDESRFAATAPHAATATTERRRAYQHPRQRQPEHWGETVPDERHAGARGRIRNVLESRVRMRTDGGRLGPFARYGGRAPWLAPNPMRSPLAGATAGGGGGEAHADYASAAHRQQHQQAMAQGLESLKSMFGESMDAEVLEAVLQQVGGSVERAVDALFAMQGSSDSPVASSEDSATSNAVVDLTGTTSTSSSASATAAPSSPSPYEASWSPPRRCVHSSSTSRAPPTASSGLRTSTSPPPSSSSSSSSSSASFADASLSSPIIFVSEEDVEFIAERKATEPRRRHLGASRPRAAVSQPSGAETSTTSSNATSPGLEMAVSSSSSSSPVRSARARRLPAFGRRFCPPRPLDTTTTSSSPSSVSPLHLPLSLPALVPDDADRRPDVSREEGVERAWRDFAEVQRETRRERKRKQTEEEISHLVARSATSSSSALSSSTPSSSTAQLQPTSRLRLPGTTTSPPGPTRR